MIEGSVHELDEEAGSMWDIWRELPKLLGNIVDGRLEGWLPRGGPSTPFASRAANIDGLSGAEKIWPQLPGGGGSTAWDVDCDGG